MREVRVTALGVEVALHLDETLPEGVAAGLRASWAGAAGGGRSLDVVREVSMVESKSASRQLSAPDPVALGMVVASGVTLAAIEANRGRLIMMHACAIALDSGQVIAFVGPSGRGKTTLARALGSHFGYVTDETVGITLDGSVKPYRKPLSILDPELQQGKKRQVAPDTLGLRALPAARLRLAAIVLLDRDSGGPQIPQVGMVPLDEAILELLPEISYLGELSQPLTSLARLIDSTGGVRRLLYREADEVAGVVDLIMTIGSAFDTSPGHLDFSPPKKSVRGEALTYMRPASADAVVAGKHLLVMHQGIVHSLDGIGPEIWHTAAVAATLEEILDAVTAIHGAPPSGDAISSVRAAVETLVEAGLLERLDA